jgi:hypothetical protein
MKEFNYKQWLLENKSGPYGKSLLFESMDSRYGVIAKTKGHLLAYPDSEGAYVKAELEAWLRKGQEAGHTRKLDFVNSKEEAMSAGEEGLSEDTYTQTYDQGGPENPQPEDEQFQESMDDIYNNQGVTNADISYYSDAELDMDNDRMPSKYSVPNPGAGVDDTAVWKEKPFNNGATSEFNRPNKYGW